MSLQILLQAVSFILLRARCTGWVAFWSSYFTTAPVLMNKLSLLQKATHPNFWENTGCDITFCRDCMSPQQHIGHNIVRVVLNLIYFVKKSHIVSDLASQATFGWVSRWFGLRIRQHISNQIFSVFGGFRGRLVDWSYSFSFQNQIFWKFQCTVNFTVCHEWLIRNRKKSISACYNFTCKRTGVSGGEGCPKKTQKAVT